MELQLIDPSRRYQPPAFDPPLPAGYLHLAASVAPPVGGPPFVRYDAGRRAVLVRLTRYAREIASSPAVARASVYRAVLIPPMPHDAALAARYDVAVLIETHTPELLDEVRSHPAYRGMLTAATAAGSAVHVMAARCSRAFGTVEPRRRGLYLFNHFLGGHPADVEAATALWEHLAGWYVAETGLGNSLLLRPIDGAEGAGDFMFVNHARFDISLPRLAAAQFAKSSFRSYVRANLLANHIVAMPVLYRLEHHEAS